MLAWSVLWTVVFLLLRIPPYIDRVFPRDTVGHAYVPVGVLGAILVGIVITVLVSVRFSWHKRAIVLLPAVALLVISGAAGIWLLIPHEPFSGRLTVPPPLNVYLATVCCAPLLGLALIGRRMRERVALLILSIVVVAVFERAWMSYSLIVWESQLLEVELSQLVWKIPGAALLAGLAAIVPARERLGAQTRPVIGGIAAVLPIVAAALLLIPFRYRYIWEPAEIGVIENARLLPSGDLVLQVSPAAKSDVGAPALLVERRGEHVLRCPFRRPVSWFGARQTWLRTDKNGQSNRIPLLVEGSLFDFIRERPRSLAIGDWRTGAMETVCEEVWNGWQGGRMCQQAAIGPGSAWAVAVSEESGVQVNGQLPSGSRFTPTFPRLVTGIWFAPDRLQILWLQASSPTGSVTGMPHMDSVDLASGKVISRSIPIGVTSPGPADQFFEPLGRGFVAQVYGDDRRAPGTLFFVNASGGVTPLGASPRLPLVFWRPDGMPIVVDEERLADAFGGQPGERVQVRELAFVDGRVFALTFGPYDRNRYLTNLYEMDQALTRATPVARNLRDVQWLSDSILYVAARHEGDRVVRRWVPSGKEEVLLDAR